ncbi:hypothetical protein H2198_002945 [Neophaeococcomyces mojaviensis]|uniref:Uncharacterized protein n=1 Tax=Neophaeococcomyces mojaviensis TaxID=3383035 RepID=A0ACC3ACU2_9EURO|nr:hypothetical protein H2198_002945 [Knufia sp. JES_112]
MEDVASQCEQRDTKRKSRVQDEQFANGFVEQQLGRPIDRVGLTNNASERFYFASTGIVGNSFNANGNMYIGNASESCKVELVDKKKLLLRTLYYTGMRTRRQQIGARAGSPESIQWIWSTEFHSWLRSPDTFFWITGLPGSGKSTLMKHISESDITTLALEANGSKWKILHFFFDFRSGASLSNSIEGLVRSLFHQLVKHVPGIADSLLEDEDSEDEKAPSLKGRYTNFQRYMDDFCDAIKLTNFKICAFIDGLDEFQGRHTELLAALETIKSRTSLKMCIASRPEAFFKTRFSSLAHIVIQEHNLASMLWYIKHAWSEARVDSYAAATEDLSSQILGQARGSFLWVRIVVDEITQGLLTEESHNQLLEKVKAMPAEVGDLYESSLERLPPRLRTEAALLLRMLADAEGKVELDRLWAGYWTLVERFGIENTIMPKEMYSSAEDRILTMIGSFVDIARFHSDRCIYSRQLDSTESDAQTCDSCADHFVYDPSQRSFEPNQTMQVRVSHETFLTFFRKRPWVTQRLPPPILVHYPENLWLRLYVAEIQACSSLAGATFLYMNSAISDFVDRYWYCATPEPYESDASQPDSDVFQSDPAQLALSETHEPDASLDDIISFSDDTESSLMKGYGHTYREYPTHTHQRKEDLVAIFNRLPFWTALLPWALDGVLVELNRQEYYLVDSSLLSAVLQALSSPVLLLHYALCLLRMHIVNKDNGYYEDGCSFLSHTKWRRQFIGGETTSEKRALALCVTHDCFGAVISHISRYPFDNVVDAQAAFDLLFESYVKFGLPEPNGAHINI